MNATDDTIRFENVSKFYGEVLGVLPGWKHKIASIVSGDANRGGYLKELVA